MAHPLLRSTIDAVAAATLAAAVWFAITSLFALRPIVATCVSAIVFIRVFASLARLPARAPGALGFVPAPLGFEPELEELLLNEPIEAAASSRVVRMFGAAPTPGEMQAAIERHLQAQPTAVPDATEELREALAELRRAVR